MNIVSSREQSLVGSQRTADRNHCQSVVCVQPLLSIVNTTYFDNVLGDVLFKKCKNIFSIFEGIRDL